MCWHVSPACTCYQNLREINFFSEYIDFVERVHAQIQKVFFDKGKRIQIALIAGHYWPASEIPFKWCFAGEPMMAQH